MSGEPSKVVKSAARRPPNAGKGRSKGVPNKVTGNMRAAIMEAFDRLGGVDYLVKVGEEDPRTFLALVARILPAEIKAEVKSETSLYALLLESVKITNLLPSNELGFQASPSLSMSADLE